jgi:predicted metalloprotease
MSAFDPKSRLRDVQCPRSVRFTFESRHWSLVLPKVQQAQRAMDQAEANGLQVWVELQGDCLAGVWASRGQAKWDFIEPGDVDSALQTASAIGDDRLQRRSQGYRAFSLAVISAAL